MNKIFAGVLMASVMTVGMPLAASASEHGMRDRDHGPRHHRQCRLVKKTIWNHGHKHVVFKKVCNRHHQGWDHR